MADVLVVDDEEELRNIVSRRLSMEWHRVFEAANGAAATKLLRVQIPDLIITDIIMPISTDCNLSWR
jgi:CheY-like chemotaxis protein